jgi:acetyltransferase
MPSLRPAAGRFHPVSLFRPESVAVVGAGTVMGGTVMQKLLGGGFKGAILPVQAGAAAIGGVLAYPDVASLPVAPDLAVIASDADDVAPALMALSARGTFAAACLAPVPGLLAAARAAGVRVVGPSAFGLIVPGIGLNASTAHLQPRVGKVALVSQSAALCRSVLDWAEPNGVGFSTVVGIGGNADIGFGAVLDWLSRDAETGAILLDIRGITDRRRFLSAARAAARLRPVVAIHAGGRLSDPTGQADAVFNAALRRAGVIRVERLADLLAAAETLTRAKPARNESVVIVHNAIGPAQMAADAALALGLPLAELTPATQEVLRLNLPPGPPDAGLVWTGATNAIRLAETAAMLSAAPEVGGVVVIMSPNGAGDDAAVQALAACQPTMRVPLLACVLGETTGAAHRRVLAGAGVPVFATPEQTMRGFGQLVGQRRARAAARELPASTVLSLAPDRAAVHRLFATARRAGRSGLLQDEALAVLTAYGIPVVPSRPALSADDAGTAAGVLGFPAVVKLRRSGAPDHRGPGGVTLDLPDASAVRLAAQILDLRRIRLDGEGLAEGFLVQRQMGRARELRIGVAEDPLFGPAILFGGGGSAAELLGDVAVDLPPLNLALAEGLIAQTRAARTLGELHEQAAADRAAVADALVRVSQLVVDFPEIAAMDLNPVFADADGVLVGDAWIALRPAGQLGVLAIAPYPAELMEHWSAKGEPLLIRPIRPEDAAAHAALFGRLTPEDIRYRFFSMLRALSPEQVARMTQVDYDREMALIAVRESTGETVGVCRLVREPYTTTGEFAVVVEAALKGRGVARHLMLRIMDWARSQGMTDITGQVLAENRPMLAFMRRMGFAIRRLPDEPDVVEASMQLHEPALAVA